MHNNLEKMKERGEKLEEVHIITIIIIITPTNYLITNINYYITVAGFGPTDESQRCPTGHQVRVHEKVKFISSWLRHFFPFSDTVIVINDLNCSYLSVVLVPMVAVAMGI